MRGELGGELPADLLRGRIRRRAARGAAPPAPAARATARRTARPRRSARRARSSGTGGRPPRRPAGVPRTDLGRYSRRQANEGHRQPQPGDAAPPSVSGTSALHLRRLHGAAPRRRRGRHAPASGGSTNAAPSSRHSVMARRAHSGVAPASPQVGVGTARSARRARSNPRRSARSKARRARARRAGGAGLAARRRIGSGRCRASSPRHRGVALRRHGRDQAEQQRDPRVPDLAQRVERRRGRGVAAHRGQRGVDPDPGHARRGQQPHGRVLGAAVHDDRRAEPPAIRSRSRSRASGAGHGPHRPPARRRRQRAGQHRGQARLVELDEHARAGPLRDLRDVRAQPLRQAGGELADGAAVGEHPVPGVQLDRRRERPRPGGLDLDPLGPGAGAGGVEGVDVEAQQVDGAAVVAAGARRSPASRSAPPRRRGRRAGPAVRPIMSAPTPRAGSSGRCGSSGSSPTTRRRPRPGLCRAASRRRWRRRRAQRTGSAGRRAEGRPDRRPRAGRAPTRRASAAVETGGGQRGLEGGVGAHVQPGVPGRRGSAGLTAASHVRQGVVVLLDAPVHAPQRPIRIGPAPSQEREHLPAARRPSSPDRDDVLAPYAPRVFGPAAPSISGPRRRPQAARPPVRGAARVSLARWTSGPRRVISSSGPRHHSVLAPAAAARDRVQGAVPVVVRATSSRSRRR